MKQPGECAGLGNWNLLAWQVSLCTVLILMLASVSRAAQTPVRERISFNADWRFAKGDPDGTAGKLSHSNIRDWVLVTGVSFTKDPNFADKEQSVGNLGVDVVYTQPRDLPLPGLRGPQGSNSHSPPRSSEMTEE